MKCIDFNIGDMIVSQRGTVAIIHDMTKNMNGNNAIYLLRTKRENALDSIPYAIVDVHLTADIENGIYDYYPIKE